MEQVPDSFLCYFHRSEVERVMQFVLSGPRETVWFSQPGHRLHSDGGPGYWEDCEHKIWEVRLGQPQPDTDWWWSIVVSVNLCIFGMRNLLALFEISLEDIKNSPSPARLGQNKLVWTKLKSVSLFSRQRNNELAGENLRWLEKVFQRTVGDHGEITLNDFKTIVQSKNVSFNTPDQV